MMKLQIRSTDHGDRRRTLQTYGCGSAVPQALVTEWVRARPWTKPPASRTAPLQEGLRPVKSHCSILAEDAIKAAVNYNSATLRSDPLRVCFLPDLPTVSKAHVCHPHWCCHRYLAKRAKGVGVLGVNRSVQAWRKASIR
jgi:hypothetical protein